MQIASASLASTMGDADLLRRAMGKKSPRSWLSSGNLFEGCAGKRLRPEESRGALRADGVLCGYGFNKSHSAAYALIAYWTAYLKAHYPRSIWRPC